MGGIRFKEKSLVVAVVATDGGNCGIIYYI